VPRSRQSGAGEDSGFAWASQVIKDHPQMPVILTTHEIAGSLYNNAAFSGYGRQVWDTLVKDNDQIFLTLNGHYWPPGRVTMQNSRGHDVQVHITNYQNRYYGGAAMLRLYHFDLARNTIDGAVLELRPGSGAARPAAEAAAGPGHSGLLALRRRRAERQCVHLLADHHRPVRPR
jgi:hypothetical protein